MFKRITILVPVLLLAQYALVRWAEGSEIQPVPPDAASFATDFSGWRRFAIDPSSAEQAITLKAGALINWTYIYAGGVSQSSANLFVAWFDSQRNGDAFLHTPDICLPGNGWTVQSRSTTRIDAASGPFSATVDVIAKGEQRDVVLYWYQTRKRAAVDLWGLKAGMALDLLTARRSDVALVRVVTPIEQGRTESAEKAAIGFARIVTPLLRDWLPH